MACVNLTIHVDATPMLEAIDLLLAAAPFLRQGEIDVEMERLLHPDAVMDGSICTLFPGPFPGEGDGLL